MWYDLVWLHILGLKGIKMSDNFPSEIKIGGELNIANFKELIDCLIEDGASHEYGNVQVSPTCTLDELLEKYTENEVLVFKNSLAVWGEFENTEKFCKKYEMPYDRWSDHYCEYSAEMVYFRPDICLSIVIDSDECKIGEIRKDLIEGLSFDCSHVIDREKIMSALAKMTAICPELPQKLERFKIVKIGDTVIERRNSSLVRINNNNTR